MTVRRRALLAGVAGFLLAAAGPETKKKKSGRIDLSTSDPAPLPPAPPAPPGRFRPFQTAPMPDSNLVEPRPAPTSNGPRLQPDFFGGRSYNNGQGYLPGSTIEGQQEQRQKPVPGFNLKMPLQ